MLSLKAPVLFRRRHIWLPTLAGWLVLLGVGALVIVGLALAVHRLLALDEPARGEDGRGARTLIVEGWIEEAALAQSITAFQRGHYERVLTTGGPVEAWSDAGGWKDYATRAAAYLRTHGIANAPVIALPAPKTQTDRTYLSALMVRAWARQAGVALDAIDVFSEGVHARRSRLLYRMALGGRVEVGVFAGATAEFDDAHWWRSSAGVKTTIGEALSLGWTLCCFWPGPPE